jgi:uncharacterized protein YjbI with pentapeptide repeats
MPQIEIKHRWTNAVLYTHETTQKRIDAGLATRDALEKATAVRANLAGADLANAYLAGANLAGANLASADLAGAYLAGANLADANLAGAYLAGAYLAGANLADANLAGAYLADAYLRDGLQAIGPRPLLQIGPIGSRMALLSVWLTDKGIYLQTGCFWDTLEAFEQAVAKEHGADSLYGHEYTAAIALAKVHAQHWTPVVEAAAPAVEQEAA